MVRTLARTLLVVLTLVATAPLAAAAAGKATGTLTVDKAPATLTAAVETTAENLFDDKKQDRLIVITDRPLGDTAPDDIDLSMRARRGDLTAMVLRYDGAKLVNVSLFYKGLGGKVLLPGAWFTVTGKGAAGSLKLAPREFDGHTYATAVDFAAVPYVAPRAPAPEAAAAPEPAEPAAPLAPATTSFIEKGAATKMAIDAMMAKDEHQAVELIKLGVDPNGKDQYGMPILSWAVMMCQPAAVDLLVKKGANVNYSRAPGLTTLAEAGACPAAAKILQAAGAK
ncbi:MAG: hypothetical protein AB7H88_21985 [Vicinamibacterales bacterium]